MPGLWSGMSKAAEEEKQEWAVEKPKLVNARKLRGIYYIDPEDGECKDTIKRARKKLEVPMEAAVPCKMGTKKRSHKLQAGKRYNPMNHYNLVHKFSRCPMR